VILYGAHKELSDWVSMGMFGTHEYYEEKSKAIGHVMDGKLIAAVTYNNFTCCPDNSFLTLEMSVHSIDKRWATRQYLRAVFHYPFIQLGLKRVQTACSAHNEGAIMFNKRLGFVQEGIMREAWPLGGDSVLFSMLKGECKWL
jgi:RimJ/RimL family protein N-acetyltransferase